MLKLDGKPFERPLCPRVQRLIKVCDAVPYGRAMTTSEMTQRMGLVKYSNPSKYYTTEAETAAVNLRKLKISPKVILWGNHKTIRDLRNGKLIL